MRTTAEQQNLIARSILGVKVSLSSYDNLIERSLCWAAKRESRALLFANVHLVMEAVDHPELLGRLNRADMVNPDGRPLMWALRLLREHDVQQVRGSDATSAALAAAEKAGIAVGFFGGTPAVLNALVVRVRRRHPHIKVAFIESPPFRVLTEAEDASAVERMASSGARWIFVGLGCPKQENWILDHVGRVPAVMFGVGAAFDFLAGSKPEAPRWMMSCGLEWFFRLALEPRRLVWRYFKHNPRFVYRFTRQFLAEPHSGALRERAREIHTVPAR